MIVSSCLLSLALLASQDLPGWTADKAKPREIRRLYWELQEYTEVSVRLIPEDPEGKPPLVDLIFQAFFPGRAERDPNSGLPQWPKGPPTRLTLRVQPLPLTMYRELSIRIVIDGRALELTGERSRYRSSQCFECAPPFLEIELEPAVILLLATAGTVGGEALGFPVKLTAADQAALREFATRTGLVPDAKR